MFSLLKLENYATTLPTSANITNETKPIGGKHTLDYEIKQDIYIVLLQLLRLILFGSIYELDSVVVPYPMITGGQVTGGSNCKRPSSEPIITTCSKKTITSSMILNQLSEQENNGTSSIMTNASQETTTATTTTTNTQTSNAFCNNSTYLEAKTTSLIQKMTLSEVVDLVMQLLTIFWSAAAGNLQLAYSCSLSASSSLNSLSTALGNYTNENNCNCNFIFNIKYPSSFTL